MLRLNEIAPEQMPDVIRLAQRLYAEEREQMERAAERVGHRGDTTRLWKLLPAMAALWLSLCFLILLGTRAAFSPGVAATAAAPGFSRAVIPMDSSWTQTSNPESEVLTWTQRVYDRGEA